MQRHGGPTSHRRQPRCGVSTACCALFLFVMACGVEPPGPAVTGPIEAPGRVLVLGIDGATLKVIRPMMEQGRLPNLQRLAEQGVSGPLRSFFPLLSPRVWTSVATGLRPNRHGVENWVTGPELGSRLMNSHDRRVHALWNILSEVGLSVATVNWLMTYPVEPIDGVVISDMSWPGHTNHFIRTLFTKNLDSVPEPDGRVGPKTYPAEWLAVVEQLAVEPAERLTGVPNPFRGNERLPKGSRILSRSAYERDEHWARLALMIDEQTRPDVMMVLLQGIDRSSHRLWGGLEPPESYPEEKRFSPDEHEASAEALLAYYEFTDQLIGLLLERFDERDLIMILSDHGFEAGGRHTGGHDSELSQDGVLFARGPGITAGTALSTGNVSVLDITPTILAWLGLPVADDMEGRPAGFMSPGHEVSRIATYETQPVPRFPFERAENEDEVLEGLREIGYIK